MSVLLKVLAAITANKYPTAGLWLSPVFYPTAVENICSKIFIALPDRASLWEYTSHSRISERLWSPGMWTEVTCAYFPAEALKTIVWLHHFSFFLLMSQKRVNSTPSAYIPEWRGYRAKTQSNHSGQ